MDSARGARSVGAVVRHGEERLPQELALEGITRMETAHAYLRESVTVRSQHTCYKSGQIMYY